MLYILPLISVLLLSCQAFSPLRNPASSNSFHSLISEKPTDVVFDEADYRDVLGNHFDLYFDIVEFIYSSNFIDIELISDDGISEMLRSISNYAVRPVRVVESENLKGINFKNLVVKLNDEKDTVLSIRQMVGTNSSVSLIIGRLNGNSDDGWLRSTHFRGDKSNKFDLILFAEIRGNPLSWNQIRGYTYNTEGIPATHYSVPLNTLQKINMNPDRLVIENTANGSEEIITVLDSGVNYNLEDIRGKLFSGLSDVRVNDLKRQLKVLSGKKEELRYKVLQDVIATNGLGIDYFEEDSFPYDYGVALLAGNGTNHGTAVSYRLLEKSNGIVVLPIRYIGGGADGRLYKNSKEFEKAVEYARLVGSRVINMSLGMYHFDLEKLETDLLNEGYNKDFIYKKITQTKENNKILLSILDIIKKSSDILFVIASGNEKEEELLNSDSGHFQELGFLKRDLPNIIVVASHDQNNNLSKFSVYGQSVHIAALGDKVLAKDETGVLAEQSGTSFSAPLVSKVVGEILYKHKNLSIYDAKKAIQLSAYKLQSMKSKLKWGGILDQQNAYAEAQKISEQK